MAEITLEFDTITAISTPPGEGAISVVRLSGDQAMQLTDRVYQSGDKRLSEAPSHTIHYGHIVDPESSQLANEVMVSVMRTPKTFTREDVVEINCHDGVVVVNQILQLLLKEDARLAEPGEFTKRAFSDGRADLSQAEAVIDLIRIKAGKAMGLALSQLGGNPSALIRSLRQEILETLAQVEVSIDYPKYDDVEELTTKLLLERAQMIQQRIQALLATSKQGKVLREGLSATIIGRPDVDKSSLLNHLLEEEKAIITDIAGTTRDVVGEYVNVRGIPLKLVDTTEIRGTEDMVERIGVERSRKALAGTDLISPVLNQSEPLTAEDEQLSETTSGLKRTILLNKADLPTQPEREELKKLIENELVFSISVARNDGLDRLESTISDLFFSGEAEGGGATYVSNTHHIALLEKTPLSLEEVITGVDSGMLVGLVQVDMMRRWDYLGEVIGDSVQDELITQLLSQFCLGK